MQTTENLLKDNPVHNCNSLLLDSVDKPFMSSGFLIMELTQELVKELFDYKDGFLYHKRNIPTANIKIGDMVGFNDGANYLKTKIKTKPFLVHRLIFLWHNGYLPKIVDHKNIDTMNNHIENLRDATPRENNVNTISRPNSTSKYLGVSWKTRANKWVVQLSFNHKKIFGGYFSSETEAALAFNRITVKINGEFASLNIVTN